MLGEVKNKMCNIENLKDWISRNTLIKKWSIDLSGEFPKEETQMGAEKHVKKNSTSLAIREM